MILVNFEDESSATSRQALLDYCCWERDDLNATFTTAIDPGGEVTGPYYWFFIPLNMVVDDDMVIRYKVEDWEQSGIRSIVSQLVNE